MATLKPAVAPTDPSLQMVSCEICGKQAFLRDTHSFIIAIAYATTGNQMASFGCPAEQHFGCSPECAAKAAHACIDEHLALEFGRRVIAREAAHAQQRER